MMAMQVFHGLLIILLVWTIKGIAAQNEPSAPEADDEDAAVVELSRRLRPLESLENKQRRLEEYQSMKRLRDNLESSHRSLEAAESQHGCSGGCSNGKIRSKVSEDLESEYPRDLHPRPIFGLINDILETARYGYKFDRPRSHIIF